MDQDEVLITSSFEVERFQYLKAMAVISIAAIIGLPIVYYGGKLSYDLMKIIGGVIFLVPLLGFSFFLDGYPIN